MENNKEIIEGYFKKIFPEHSCRLNVKGDKWLLEPNPEDYPLQHGKGESYAIPVVLIDAILEPVPDTQVSKCTKPNCDCMQRHAHETGQDVYALKSYRCFANTGSDLLKQKTKPESLDEQIEKEKMKDSKLNS